MLDCKYLLIKCSPYEPFPIKECLYRICPLLVDLKGRHMLKKIFLSITSLLVSSVVHANTVDFSYVSPNTTVTTSVSVNSSTLTTYMGSYNLLAADTVNTIVGFCVDPFQWASSTPTPYDRSALDASDFISGDGANRLINAQKLFDNAYASLSGNEQTAGFHLALWEIFHDDLNTASGIIAAATGSDTGMLVAANTFLASLNGWNTTNAYDLTFYGSGQQQDYISANVRPSEVPLPAALPLFVSSLLGFGVMRRRKS
jgi:hypothetical protein